MNAFFLKTLLAAFVGNSFVLSNFFAAFGRGPWLRVAIPWFACMACAPLISLALGYSGPVYDLLAWLETRWLAYLTVLFVVFVGLDILQGVRWLLERVCKRPLLACLPFRRAALLVLVPVALFSCYAFYEAHTIRAVHYTIRTDKLPEGSAPLRVVFASDVHINSRLTPEHLARIVDCINAQKPDLILLGGDVIDAPTGSKTEELRLLQQLQAPMGKYAVLGNHELAYSLDDSIQFLQQAGFRLLRQEAAAAGPLTIVGVDDPAVSEAQGSNKDAVLPVLETVEQSRFTILLHHRPTIDPKSIGLFDLQLSGHSHGGHFRPADHLMEWTHGTPNGLSSHRAKGKKDSELIVTHGTGFGRVPLRFLIPPEVVVIDLESSCTPPSGTFPLPANSFLLRDPGAEGQPARTILIDTGLGHKLTEHLAARGVTPEAVDTILLTHMHFDHIGGLLQDGKAFFPKATRYIAGKDLLVMGDIFHAGVIHAPTAPCRG